MGATRRDAIRSASPVLRQLRGLRTRIVGAARRGSDDLDSLIVVVEEIPEIVMDLLRQWSPMKNPQRKQTAAVVLGNLPLYVVSTRPEYWGAHLLFYTGPSSFKRCVCSDAKIQGYKLNPLGLWHGKYRIAGRSEQQIFDCLGLPWFPPKERGAFFSPARKEIELRTGASYERRKVFLAIDTIVKSRRKGDIPAKRTEISKETGLDVLAVEVSLQWLLRHKLIDKVPGGWRARIERYNDVCWIHGKTLPCNVCERKEARFAEK